jgi:hypothetical protein
MEPTFVRLPAPKIRILDDCPARKSLSHRACPLDSRQIDDQAL